MLLENSNKSRDMQARLTVFMDQHVYPNEQVYTDQHDRSGDP